MAVPREDDPEIAVLRARLEEYRLQYNLDTAALDRSAVEHLYKMDADFTAYDIAPPLEGYKGWEAYGTAWAKVLLKYSEISFIFIDEPRIFYKGDVAWMSVAAIWSGLSKGDERFEKKFRTTLVWVKEAGHWRITHEHGSSPITTTLSGGGII